MVKLVAGRKVNNPTNEPTWFLKIDNWELGKTEQPWSLNLAAEPHLYEGRGDRLGGLRHPKSPWRKTLSRRLRSPNFAFTGKHTHLVAPHVDQRCVLASIVEARCDQVFERGLSKA